MVRNKKNHRSKKVWIASLTGAMLIAVSAAFLWIPSFASQSDKIAVTINGISLPVELLEEEMKTAVPKVYSYFESEHQVEDVSQNGFWETSFDGERPIDYARQLVLEKWVRYTVVLQEAKKNDLIQDITYDGLVKQWEEENRQRKQDLEDNQIVYGPYSYSWDGFLDVQITNYIDKLAQIYAKSDFSLSEQELKDLYEKEKDSRYRYDDDVSVKILKCDYDKTDTSGNSQEEAKKKIQDAYDALCRTGSMEIVAEEKGIPLEEKEYLCENAELDNETDGVLRQAALQLEATESSEIIQDPSQGVYAVIQCSKRVENGFISFEEKKEEIQLEYARDCLESRVDSLIAEADVVVNEEAYYQIWP